MKINSSLSLQARGLMMLFYFILFCLGGAVISAISQQLTTALGVMLAIAIIWSFSYGVGWGIVSLIEMLIGLGIHRYIIDNS